MNEELTEQYWIDVQVEDEWPADEVVLHRAALATLVYCEAPPVEVAVVISSDEALHELNLRFRGIDAPTDVLAFPNEPRGPYAGIGEQPDYLGDVIISFPRAAEQATEGGHAVIDELQLLVVHGVLHLLGHDDQAGPARSQMWAAQTTILGALGVEIDLPD